jgi:hypothetical protein
MVIKLIGVFMVRQCNVYVIPKSLGRNDFGYKCRPGVAISRRCRPGVVIATLTARDAFGPMSELRRRWTGIGIAMLQTRGDHRDAAGQSSQVTPS